MTYSIAAASKSLGRLMPSTSPATYAILTLSCILYGVCLVETMRRSGFEGLGGGFFGLGGIDGEVLQRMGASLPLPINLMEPYRFVTAVFLHGSLLHIIFNMWVLLDIGPQIEEVYGSAKFLFFYVITGIGGYALSSAFGNFSVGGSGALLGLIGVLLALTVGSQNIGMRMLRQQLIRWLVYILIFGLLMRGTDNLAHIGGLATGFVLGRIITARPPATAQERNLAYALGWAAALIVVASFAMIARGVFLGS